MICIKRRPQDHEAVFASTPDPTAAAAAGGARGESGLRRDLLGPGVSRSCAPRLASCVPDPGVCARCSPGVTRCRAFDRHVCAPVPRPTMQHGGFCSVSMAAGSGSTHDRRIVWSSADRPRPRQLFVMIGTAEDHHRNPLKVATLFQTWRAIHLRSTRCVPATRRSPMNGCRSLAPFRIALLPAITHEIIINQGFTTTTSWSTQALPNW